MLRLIVDEILFQYYIGTAQKKSGFSFIEANGQFGFRLQKFFFNAL